MRADLPDSAGEGALVGATGLLTCAITGAESVSSCSDLAGALAGASTGSVTGALAAALTVAAATGGLSPERAPVPGQHASLRSALGESSSILLRDREG
jgi:hypothetical protein